MQTALIPANGQTFFTRTAGATDAPFVLLLHGFPEYGGAWDALLPHLADAFFVAAPDQRGYGRSSKPLGVAHYKAHLLAADMLELAQQVAPGRAIHLIGHDWGASVAYAMAFLAPNRIAKLIVINGVHPVPFQRALLSDPAQRAASQYIRFLRRDDAAPLLLADGCRRVLQFLTAGFGGGAWLTPEKRSAYIDAWTQPGAMEGMVSWYKATPLTVPLIDEVTTDDPTTRMDLTRLRVRMPHLVIWGSEDKALLPARRSGLDAFCDHPLRVVDVPATDHWIVHQQPEVVAGEIRAFFQV